MIDEKGERLAGGMKTGVSSLTTEAQERMLESHATIVLGMAKIHEAKTGTLRCSLFCWDKIIAAFFPLSAPAFVPATKLRRWALVVTFDAKEIHLSETLEKIEETLQRALIEELK